MTCRRPIPPCAQKSLQRQPSCGNRCIQVNQFRQVIGAVQAVGRAGDDHAAVGMAHQYRVLSTPS